MPPTIQAVLQARLDALDERERGVVDRGAVEGKVFHRGAVTALAPDELREDVPGRLLALVRKEIVRPDRTQIAGDDAFRFRHLLIRDTAYEALPKAARAELHERFADWLDGHGDLLEQDEIVGYHLEQSARYRVELDQSDEAAAGVAQRAAGRLGRAGLAAVEREDLHAVRSLLGRAIAVLPPGSPDRLALLPPLVEALIQVRAPEADELMAELERGSPVDAATALALRLVGAGHFLGMDADPTGTLDDHLRTLDRPDEIGWRTRALYERAHGWAAFGRLRMREASEAFERSLELTLAADSRANLGELVRWTLAATVHGPYSGAELEATTARLEAIARDIGLSLVADDCLTVLTMRRFLRGAIARDELESALLAAIDALESSGFHVSAAVRYSPLALSRELTGDLAEAERWTRVGIELLAAVGDRGFRGNALGSLARLLCDQGRPQEARAAIGEGRSISQPEDLADQILFDVIDAYAAALLGDAAHARELVGRAEDRAVGIDSVSWQEAVTLARTFAAIGDIETARRRYEHAIELIELKAVEIALPMVRDELAALG